MTHHEHEPSQDRLDELGERIDEARRKADEQVPSMDGEEGEGLWTDTDPAFHESGERRGDLDDQTIAPPG